MKSKYNYPWYKNNPLDKVWWKDGDSLGEMIFSFDRVHEFNLWTDYPKKVTHEQKSLFDRENPEWKKFFEP